MCKDQKPNISSLKLSLKNEDTIVGIKAWRELLREDINRRKMFPFGHCQNHLTPPPPDPNSGILVLFFGRQEQRFASMTEFFLNDDNDGFNDNYDDNFDYLYLVILMIMT